MTAISLPVGTVISYMGLASTIDTLHGQGWLVCDGSVVAQTDYPELYDAIQGTYGQTGQDVFNLPDLRGIFMRGIDPTGVVDPDAGFRTSPWPQNPTEVGPVIGSRQGNALVNHQHNWDYNFSSISDDGSDIAVQIAPNPDGSYPSEGGQYSGPTTETDGGTSAETRPVNCYVYYLILASSGNAGADGEA